MAYKRIKHTSKAEKWSAILLPGAFISFFLTIFQPFGLTEHPFWISASYGIVTFAVLLPLVHFFPENLGKIRGNTFKYNLIFNLCIIFLIGLANAIYSAIIINDIDLTWRWILIFEGYTFAIGLIVVGLIPLLFKKRSIKDNINDSLHTVTMVTLHSEYKSDELRINPAHLIAINSSGNYVTVYFRKNEEIQSKMIRTTLKRVEEDLLEQKVFLRCHRSWVIDTTKPWVMKKGDNKHRLVLENFTEEVPVARNLTQQVNDALNTIR